MKSSHDTKDVVSKSKCGDAADEFFNGIRDRRFAFEEMEQPQTINGIRGQKIFAEKFSKELDFPE